MTVFLPMLPLSSKILYHILRMKTRTALPFDNFVTQTFWASCPTSACYLVILRLQKVFIGNSLMIIM